MTSSWFFIACQISVIACTLVAGVFLTFSDFVMRSLDGAQSTAGVEVMQGINREVFRSVFMALFLGMAALSPVLIGYAYFNLAGSVFGLIMIGGALYLFGVFAVTAVFNVPMNNRLEAMSHTDAGTYWTDAYVPRWTAWNSIRAVASAGAAVCFLLAVSG